MTTPQQVRRTTHTLHINANTLATRIPHTLTALTTHHDGYPTTASGSDTGPRGNPELTTTEAAAHANLGDLHNLTTGKYRPGPNTQLADLHELVAGANDLLQRALAICDQHTVPYEGSSLRCSGTGDAAGATCTQYADPRRNDGKCIDCGRTHDSNTRRLRRHAQRGDAA